MKAFKVTFQRGHFFDIATGNRIIPVSGFEYIITGEEDGFSEVDEKFSKLVPLNPVEKLKAIQEEFNNFGYYKILEAGSRLFFRIGNSKKLKEEDSQQYIFACTLQEDLYLYKVKERKGNKEDDWRLADCVCVLDECLVGSLSLTQEIQADSLNKLFSHIVTFYFPHQRSASANAFSTFFLYDGKPVRYSGPINETFKSLGKLRKGIIKGKA